MNIGLIAHDAKKTLLQNLCIAYRAVLAKHTLYATGTSGRLIEEATGLNSRNSMSRMSTALSVSATYTAFRLQPILQRQKC